MPCARLVGSRRVRGCSHPLIGVRSSTTGQPSPRGRCGRSRGAGRPSPWPAAPGRPPARGHRPSGRGRSSNSAAWCARRPWRLGPGARRAGRRASHRDRGGRRSPRRRRTRRGRSARAALTRSVPVSSRPIALAATATARSGPRRSDRSRTVCSTVVRCGQLTGSTRSRAWRLRVMTTPGTSRTRRVAGTTTRIWSGAARTSPQR